MTRLYELTSDESSLIELLDSFSADEDRETYEAIEEQLKFTRDDIEHRVDRITKMISELKALAEARKSESERLAISARVHFNKAERLKNYLQYCFERDGTEQVSTKTHTAKMQRTGGTPPLHIDESKLPPRYFETHMTTKVNRQKIWNDLKSAPDGTVIPGVTIGDNGRRLRIK